MPFQIVKLVDSPVVISAGSIVGPAIAASNTTFTSGTVEFQPGSNVSISTNASGIVIHGAAGGTGGGGGVAIAGSGASTITSGTLQFANSNGISFGLNGSTMTGSINAIPYTGASTDVNFGAHGISSLYTINMQTSGVTRNAQEGQIAWDQKNRCLAIDMMNDSRLQVGQENYIICYNDTAGTLTNGKVVYQTGVKRYEYSTGLFGDYPTVEYAIGDVETRSLAIGVLTMDIAPGGLGFATALGVVNDLDTSGFVSGDLLYVSEITAGTLTSTKPAVPYFATLIGRVLRVHATAGNILVRPQLAFTTDDVQDRLDNIQSTGIISGGSLTINGTAKFDLGTGLGVVVDNYTDPEDPVKTYIRWAAQAALDPLNIATQDATYIYINSAGTVVLSNSWITNEDRRDLITVGWIDHKNHTTISELRPEPFCGIDLQCQLNDFWESYGSFNIYGNVYSAHTGLQIARSEGSTFDNNANHYISEKNPHVIYHAVDAPVTFTNYYQSAPTVWVNNGTPTTTIDPDYYDSGSGLVAVTTGYWTIKQISYYASFDSTDIQYGQAEYATLLSAKAAIRSPIVINPYNSYNSPRGWLIVKQGATDLTNVAQAVFVPCGRITMDDLESGSDAGLLNLTDHNDLDNIQGGQTNQRYHLNLTQYNNVTNGIVNSLSFTGNTSGTMATVTGGIVFSGGNNITLSQNGNTIVISGPNAGGAQTGISGIADSANTVTIGTVQFANSNGVSFGLNGSTMTAAVAGGGAAIKGSGTYSQNTGTVEFANSNGITFGLSNNGTMTAAHNALTGATVFSNSNNVSFGLNGSTVTGSASFVAQTNQTLSLAMASQSTGNTSGMSVDARSLSFGGKGNISVGLSTSAGGSTIMVSGSQSVQTQGMVSINGNTGAIQFSNSNNVSFGINVSTVTASASFAAQTNQTMSLAMVSQSTGNTSGMSVDARSLSFGGKGDISVGLSTSAGGSTVMISGSQSVQTQGMVSINGNTGAIVFSNSNNVSFGINASTVTGSASFAQSTQPVAFQGANGSALFSTLIFSNAGGVTWSTGAGGIYVGSLVAGAAAGIGAIAGSNTTYTSGTVIFSGSNITVSSSVNGGSQYIQLTAPNASTLSAVTNITIGSTGSTIGLSAHAPGISWELEGAQTAGTTGSSLSGGSLYLSGGANVTLSGNSNTIIISAAAGGGAAPTLKVYEPYNQLSPQVFAQGTVYIQPIHVLHNMTATKMDVMMLISNSASAAGTCTLNLGMYTFSQNTANAVSNTSRTFAYNSTMAASSYTHVSGTRYISFSLNNWALTPGNYLIAIGGSIATALTSGSYSFFGRTSLSHGPLAYAGGNISSWGYPGVLTAASNASKASFHMSDIARTGAAVNRQPWILFQGTA